MEQHQFGLEDESKVCAILNAFDRFAAIDMHCATSGSLGFGLIHYSLIRTLRPENVLAIGSKAGFIPAIIACALKANGTGRLQFVDANYSGVIDGLKAYGGIGRWTRPKEEVFALFELHRFIDIEICPSDNFFAQNAKHFGYIYLDGDRSLEGVQRDITNSLAALDPGGIIAIHDSEPDSTLMKYGLEVAEAIRSYNEVNIHRISIRVSPGLTFIQPIDEPASQSNQR